MKTDKISRKDLLGTFRQTTQAEGSKAKAASVAEPQTSLRTDEATKVSLTNARGESAKAVKFSALKQQVNNGDYKRLGPSSEKVAEKFLQYFL